MKVSLYVYRMFPIKPKFIYLTFFFLLLFFFFSLFFFYKNNFYSDGAIVNINVGLGVGCSRE